MFTPIFDASDHSYHTPDGRRLISVTQALTQAGIIDTRWFDEDSAWRGSVIHKVCELDDKGTLLESSVDPAAWPYLDAWRACKRNIGFKAAHIEVPMYHPELLFAGTPDRISDEFVIDLKTGAEAKWHALQLDAYRHLLPHPRRRRRLTVRLQPNGRYFMAEYTGSADFAVFQSCLNIANWKGTHGN